jgi:hypothetical protein
MSTRVVTLLETNTPVAKTLQTFEVNFARHVKSKRYHAELLERLKGGDYYVSSTRFPRQLMFTFLHLKTAPCSLTIHVSLDKSGAIEDFWINECGAVYMGSRNAVAL